MSITTEDSKNLIRQRALTLKNQAVLKKHEKGLTRKQQMQLAINKINVSVLEEISRLRKPQRQAKLVGKLFCVLLCTFKQPPLQQDYPLEMLLNEFENWDNVQSFTFTNPNKTLSACQAIKNKTSSK